jgi:DnaK suppressor protein
MIPRSNRDAPVSEGTIKEGEKSQMPSTTARAAKMPKKELEKYRRLLVDKKSSLVSDLAKTKNAEEETTEESTQDIADKAVSSYTREFLYSLNDVERNTIQQTDQALSRIEDGSYGFCQNCGNAMSEKRLSAIPWSRHCVDCQELAEKGLLEA